MPKHHHQYHAQARHLLGHQLLQPVDAALLLRRLGGPKQPGEAADLRDLLAQFPGGIPQVDPRKTVAILHGMMQRAGWAADQSAGAIVGAAWAVAVQELGGDGARRVVVGDPED